MRTCDTNLWPYFETLGASYLQTVLSDPHNSSLYREGVAGHLHAKHGHTTLLSSNAFSKPVHQKSMRGWSWELHRGRIARQRSTCWSSAEDPFLSRDPWPRRSWCCSSACQQLYYNMLIVHAQNLLLTNLPSNQGIVQLLRLLSESNSVHCACIWLIIVYTAEVV